jgi:hypothetical protein
MQMYLIQHYIRTITLGTVKKTAIFLYMCVWVREKILILILSIKTKWIKLLKFIFIIQV